MSATKAADAQVPAGAGTPPTTAARAAGRARAEADSTRAARSAGRKAKDSLRIEVVVGRNPKALRSDRRADQLERACIGLAQVLVDEGDRHAALADGRCDALHRPEAHVAAGEDAGDARLEQVGVALELPLAPCLDVRAG